MKKWIYTFPLILITFSAYGQNTDKFTGSLLWRITGNGLEQPSYIFGTHHLAEISFAQNYPGFNEALESAGQVVGELLMADKTGLQNEIMRHAVITDGTTYRTLLPEEDYNALNEALRRDLGTGLDQLGALKPAMISTLYSQRIYARVMPEFNPLTHISIDQYVQETATRQRKKVIGLETVEDQIQVLFYSESLEEQARSLACMAGNLHSTEQSVLTLNECYANGDLYGAYALSLDNPDDPCRMSEASAQALLNKRNDHWMEQLPGIMADGASFVAVGMLHLCGEEGLLYRLDQLGYTVEPVQ